jgi:hypothetical protein
MIQGRDLERESASTRGGDGEGRHGESDGRLHLEIPCCWRGAPGRRPWDEPLQDWPRSPSTTRYSATNAAMVEASSDSNRGVAVAGSQRPGKGTLCRVELLGDGSDCSLLLGKKGAA